MTNNINTFKENLLKNKDQIDQNKIVKRKILVLKIRKNFLKRKVQNHMDLLIILNILKKTLRKHIFRWRKKKF